MLRTFRQKATLLFATAALLAAPSQADAVFQIRFQQAGFADLTVGDRVGAVGDANDSNPNANQITAILNYGDFTISVTSSTTNAPGSATLGQLVLNFTDLALNDSLVGVGGSRTITISGSATDFNNPPTGNGLDATLSTGGSFSITNSNSDTITTTGFVNDDNGAFSTTGPSGSTTRTRAEGTGLGDTVTFGPVGAAPPFSLVITRAITLTNLAGSDEQFSSTSVLEVRPSAVPAPAGLLLLAGAVPLLGAAGWRKWRKSA